MKVLLSKLAKTTVLAAGAASFVAMPGLAHAESILSGWHLHGYYENQAQYRGRDASGHTPGLSMERNRLQFSVRKNLFGDLLGHLQFHGVFRADYNAVYDLNADTYGSKAGGPVSFQNTVGGGDPFPASSPFGHGLANHNTPGLPPTNVLATPVLGGTAFTTLPNGSVVGYGPNDGLQLIGQHWHPTRTGGIEFATPVRPCNDDPRGCADFGGYGDLSSKDLRFPTFNDRLDFIREAYLSASFHPTALQTLHIKLGRQQVVWGRTDLFRVLDVINPVDYSQNNIYDPLQDIRIPMLMLTTDYDFGPSKWFMDTNVQLVWNFGRFMPNNLGQCGTPNVILNAGCTFRGLKNLWDRGGTVSNFAAVSATTHAPGPLNPGDVSSYLSTNFGPHQIGIRNVDLPAWQLKNSQIGIKFGGTTADGALAFTFNALSYRSQLPSLHSINGAATNSFTGAKGNTGSPPPFNGLPVKNLIAFDMVYPRVNLVGGSAGYVWAWAKSTVRFEWTYTSGEEFVNTLKPGLFSSNNVFRSVIGLDRLTFIPFISGRQATLISAQVFFQHIFDFQRNEGPMGERGMPGWENNATFTLLIQPQYMHGQLVPQILFAHDFMARSGTVSPSIKWLVNDHVVLDVGVFMHYYDRSRYTFSNCTSCNPWPPFTSYTSGAASGDLGRSGFEPLGIFRGGPLGMAGKENQVFARLRISF